MGFTNDATKACGIPLIELKPKYARFTLCAACKKVGNQHIVREKLQLGDDTSRAWPKLETAMHLRDATGRSHSRDFDMLIPGKVKNWVTRRVKELIEQGIAKHHDDPLVEGHKLVYANWTRAWLLPQWDGNDFSEEFALDLLAKYEDAATKHKASVNHFLEPIVPQPTILMIPGDSICPHQSASQVGCAAESVEELEEALLDGACELAKFTCMIIMLEHSSLGHRPFKQQADFLQVLEQATRGRLKLLDELLEIEGQLDRAHCLRLGILPTTSYPLKGRTWSRFMINGAILALGL
ncbi:hypothetical protein G7046_g6197 [Stylonectria norvegica]|nr:hypothetical protein G7046_g6197 [Stylonectria norvegica]